MEKKYEVIKDKKFKKEIDNAIEFITLASLGKGDRLEQLNIALSDANAVRETLDKTKELSLKNNYANQIISKIESDVLQIEIEYNNFIEQEKHYEELFKQLTENYTENATGYRKYNIEFFKTIINVLRLHGYTNDLSEDELKLKEHYIKKEKELKNKNVEKNN